MGKISQQQYIYHHIVDVTSNKVNIIHKHARMYNVISHTFEAFRLDSAWYCCLNGIFISSLGGKTSLCSNKNLQETKNKQKS